MALEQNRLDHTLDPLELKPASPDPELVDLKIKLEGCMESGHMDGFLLFLMGIIYKKLELKVSQV
jgi:hypothetical protein